MWVHARKNFTNIESPRRIQRARYNKIILYIKMENCCAFTMMFHCFYIKECIYKRSAGPLSERWSLLFNNNNLLVPNSTHQLCSYASASQVHPLLYIKRRNNARIQRRMWICCVHPSLLHVHSVAAAAAVHSQTDTPTGFSLAVAKGCVGGTTLSAYGKRSHSVTRLHMCDAVCSFR